MIDDIETFYDPKRKRTDDGMLAPSDFEARQQKLTEAAAWENN